MENTLHYLVMVLQSDIKKMLMKSIKDTPLTQGQPKVLEHLYYHDGSLQKDIALSCHLEAATVTSVLSGMEKCGLIERRMENENRRNLHVYLTEKGRALSERVVSEFAKIDEELFKNISIDEKDALIRAMHEISIAIKMDECDE